MPRRGKRYRLSSDVDVARARRSEYFKKLGISPAPPLIRSKLKHPRKQKLRKTVTAKPLPGDKLKACASLSDAKRGGCSKELTERAETADDKASAITADMLPGELTWLFVFYKTIPSMSAFVTVH